MATCSSADSILEAAALVKANGAKIDKFTNGTATETVQLGSGAATPVLRNVVRQMLSAGSEIEGTDASGKYVLASGGTTEMRSLADRFADAVNVKDFGAAGDGETDDTAAIAAAIAAANGRAVLFPEGSYISTENFQYDRMYCLSDAVALSPIGMNVQNIGVKRDWETLKAKRRLVAALDFPSFFTGSSALSGYSCQALEVTPSYIFVGIRAVSTADSLTYGYVSMFSKEGEYLTTFCTGVLSSGKPYNEMLNAFEHDAYVDVYSVKASASTDASNHPARFRISKASLPATGTLLTPDEEFSDIVMGYNGFVVENSAFLVTNNATPFNTVADYTYFKKYDYDQNLKGYIKLFAETTRASSGLPKMQSSTCGGGMIAAGYGGWYSLDESETVTDEQKYGVKLFAGNGGSKIFSVLFDPQKTCQKLASVLGDVGILVCENEGISILDGRVYTLQIMKHSSNTSGMIAVFEEFSSSPEAIDFTDCIADDAYPSQTQINRPEIPFIEGQRINPFTGEALSSMTDVLDMMYAYDVHEIAIYTSNNAFYHVDGTTLYPDYAFIHVSKGTNITYFVQVNARNNGANRTTLQLINGSVGSWSEEILDIGTKDLYLNGVFSDNSAGRIYAFTHPGGARSEVLRWYSDSSQTFASLGGADCDTVYVRLEETGGKYYGFSPQFFYPGVSSTASLGTADRLWSQVYAGTSTISTSDERLKTGMDAPSEALMRAWGKVGFKVFQFCDAVARKGAGAARFHVGVIAQQVIEAFASEGLDATRYGLLCHDSWEAREEVRDSGGNIVQEARTAGDVYGIRYEEALALECAYQRWLGEKRDARLAELEAKLNENSGNGPAPSGALPDNI